jgi:hypothetical protein
MSIPACLAIAPTSGRVGQAGQFQGKVDLGDGVVVTSSGGGTASNGYLVEYAP